MTGSLRRAPLWIVAAGVAILAVGPRAAAAPGGDGFFAEHGDVGGEFTQAGFDDGSGALVGEGDGRAVEFCLRVEAGGAHGHDLAAGGEGESDEGVEVDGHARAPARPRWASCRRAQRDD